MRYMVAEEPVRSYLVSAKFPANRENNSEFPLFSAVLSQRAQILVPLQRVIKEFPATGNRELFRVKQGSFPLEQGTGSCPMARRHDPADAGFRSRLVGASRAKICYLPPDS